jgi:hypothetical protein
MTVRGVTCVVVAIALCVVVPACSYEPTDDPSSAVAPSEDASADAIAEANRTCGSRRGLGLPCDVGSGQGACAKGGTMGCGGICQPADPSIGDATAWHIVTAPNGSWDWDCDGVVNMNFVPTPAPPECSTYGDSQNCNGASTIDYVAEASPCGEQATLFRRDCDWKTLGPTCLDTPAGHRVVFQQCR